MSADFNEAIALVLKHEGGFVQDLEDPGGATNFGISLRYLQSLGRVDHNLLEGDFDHDGDVDADDIKNMTAADARGIYLECWWNRYHYAEFEQATANKIMDTAVNVGAKQCARLAQRACGDCGQILEVDGVMGNVTRAFIRSIPEPRFLAAFRKQQAQFYTAVVQTHPDELKFLDGWLKRAAT